MGCLKSKIADNYNTLTDNIVYITPAVKDTELIFKSRPYKWAKFDNGDYVLRLERVSIQD